MSPSKPVLATVTQLLRRRYWIIKRSHQAFGRVRAWLIGLLRSAEEGGRIMKSLIVALAFCVALPVSAFAQDAPPFLKAIEPQAAVNSAWQEWLAVFNPNGALDGKTKELIGLAVAAQVPCGYCVYAHTLGAKHAGATDEQIKEAIAASALVRKMSTEFNGNQYDMAEFKKEIDAAYANMKTQ
jgi:AhpD family alkylhydroperoxidase